MKESFKFPRKKLEKISFEELMGAAGMSGFGALLERPPGIETAGWQPWAESRLKFSLKASALAEKLAQQNDALRSLSEPLKRRVASLEQALVALSRITCTISTLRVPKPTVCAAYLVNGLSVPSAAAEHSADG